VGIRYREVIDDLLIVLSRSRSVETRRNVRENEDRPYEAERF
jgi:hypothetical protein